MTVEIRLTPVNPNFNKLHGIALNTSGDRKGGYYTGVYSPSPSGISSFATVVFTFVCYSFENK